MFILGDFNVHDQDWLPYSGGTDRPVELCYIFSISNDLAQMVNFPTWILDCNSHSPALLDLFISSDASIYSTMAFPPLGNSDHQPWESMAAVSNSVVSAVFCGIYESQKIAVVRFSVSVVYIFTTYIIVDFF